MLSRALGLPRDPAAAARQVGEALEAGRTRTISVGRVNGRRFSFSAGLGFDSELVRRVDARGRRDDGKRPGDTAFIAAALGLVAERRLRFEPVLEVGGLGRAAFALVANTDPYTYAGAIPIHVAAGGPLRARPRPVRTEAGDRSTLPRLLRHLVTGKGVRERDVVYGHDLDRIEITCDRPLPLQVDGEDLGDVEHAVFEAERGAIAVLV